MKQFKNRKSQQPLSTTSVDQNPTKNKNKVLGEIDKIQKQIQQANEDIKKTQKMLDVDLFLKQQKQKRLDYAKQINADYQAQKKIREEKLYKKFKRDEKQDRGDRGDDEKGDKLGSTVKIEQGNDMVESKTNDKVQFKFMNIPVLNPITIVKVLLNQRGPDQCVKDGHHYKPDDIKMEGIRQSEQKMFENLYVNPNEKRKYDADLESKHYAWRNIKQVVENPMEMITQPKQIGNNQLVPNNFQAQNILGAVILMNDRISKETFAQNSELFLSQLFTPNGQKTVIVDKFVKIRQFPHKYVNLGSRCQNPNIMWPTLIQKSVEKLKISTNMPHISNSICKSIYTFFGLDPQIVPISNKNVIKQNFHFVLGYLIHEGAVGFINVNGYSNKSYENRIYPLQEVKQQLKKQGNLQKKKQIKYKIKNPWRGKLLHNENVNRFTLLQLLQLFNCIVLLRDYPNKYQCLRIQVSYFSNGSISPTSNEWTKNPQYLFTITKPTNLRIILRKSGELNQTAQQKQSVYGFLLFQNKQASNKIQALKMDWLIVKTKSVDFGQAMYSAEIGRGNYILIPYSTQQSTKEYQFYVLDFIVQRQSNIQFGKARFFDYNYAQKKGKRLNTGQSKIIQSLESTQIFQKPRIQRIPLPSQFKPQFIQDDIRKLPLNIFKQCSIKNFFMPGQISNLLINKSIEIELKQNKNKEILSNAEMQDNQELKREENSQNLEILLGYDVLNGDQDINQGIMNQIIQQSVGQYDFRDFGLGQEGLIAILEALSIHPQIFSIDLSGNDLDDYSITFLCYSLQKGNRTQLRQLNVERNKFGKIGKNALKGLKGTFPKLQIKGSS